MGKNCPSMQFDRQRFYEQYRRRFGKLNDDQVRGIERLLTGYERYYGWWNFLPQIANSLAQVKHETAHSFLPVVEGYYLGDENKPNYFIGNTERVARFQRSLRYYPHFGMGDIQLTWAENYEEQDTYIRQYFPEIVAEFETRSGQKFDLVKNPKQALDPWISFAAMTIGMHKGTFREGHTLDRYINPKGVDHFTARNIVNGDRYYKNRQGERIGDVIARDALKFTAILEAALRDADENDILEIKPDSSEAGDPAGSLVDSQKPTSITDETPEPGAAGSPAVNGDGGIEPAKISSPEPYNGIGFWATIKRDLGAVTGGNITFEGLSTYAQQASGWPEWVVSLLTKVAVIVLIASVGYLVFRVIHFAVDSWKKNKRVGYEIVANTAVDKRDIAWTQ